MTDGQPEDAGLRCDERSGASILTRRPASSTRTMPELQLDPLREDVELDLDRSAVGADPDGALARGRCTRTGSLRRPGLDRGRPFVRESRDLAEPAAEERPAVVDVDRLVAEAGEVLGVADRVDHRTALRAAAARAGRGSRRRTPARSRRSSRRRGRRTRPCAAPSRAGAASSGAPRYSTLSSGHLVISWIRANSAISSQRDWISVPRPVEERRGQLDRALTVLAGDVDLGRVEERADVAADEDPAGGRAGRTRRSSRGAPAGRRHPDRRARAPSRLRGRS